MFLWKKYIFLCTFLYVEFEQADFAVSIQRVWWKATTVAERMLGIMRSRDARAVPNCIWSVCRRVLSFGVNWTASVDIVGKKLKLAVAFAVAHGTTKKKQCLDRVHCSQSVSVFLDNSCMNSNLLARFKIFKNAWSMFH